jgi:hypothetical protein
MLTNRGIKDRKFFDSGDYALSKAGKAPRETVGTAIPNPEKYVDTHLNSINPHISFTASLTLLLPRSLTPPVPTFPCRFRP